MVIARKFVVEKHFDGLPKEADLKLVEEELPKLKDGEFLTKAVYISVDPYQRGYASRVPLGSTFIGSQVAKIIESKNSKYPVGGYVVGEYGWRTHTIDDGRPLFAYHPPPPDGFPAAWLLPDFEGLPLSLSLGVLGMPGITAYFGFLEICQPKPGETVIVTGAAGAVGSIVGQLAKIKGCTVIGVTGSDEKGRWLVEELKFDRFVNYKDENFDKRLEEVAPNGIDCYFDNVGGDISSKILSKMNTFGRIVVCGSISGYNDAKPVRADAVQPFMLSKQLKMEGIIFNRWQNRWDEGIQQNKQWIKQGKLKYKETVTEGFENTLKAFVDMLQGGNCGKAVVKV